MDNKPATTMAQNFVVPSCTAGLIEEIYNAGDTYKEGTHTKQPQQM
jgi:hypothetical protein